MCRLCPQTLIFILTFLHRHLGDIFLCCLWTYRSLLYCEAYAMWEHSHQNSILRIQGWGVVPWTKVRNGGWAVFGKLVHPTPAHRSPEDSQGCQVSIVTWKTVRFKTHIHFNAIYIFGLSSFSAFVCQRRRKKKVLGKLNNYSLWTRKAEQ